MLYDYNPSWEECFVTSLLFIRTYLSPQLQRNRNKTTDTTNSSKQMFITFLCFIHCPFNDRSPLLPCLSSNGDLLFWVTLSLGLFPTHLNDMICGRSFSLFNFLFRCICREGTAVKFSNICNFTQCC